MWCWCAVVCGVWCVVGVNVVLVCGGVWCVWCVVGVNVVLVSGGVV
jgi:hypothetical protein